MEWFEELPQQCPPLDAVACNGKYYRIAQGVPTESSDYFSQRKLQPYKEFIGAGVDECIVRSLSVFSSLDEARKRLKLPKFKSQLVVELDLTPKDGVMKQTFGPNHYSWWRSTEFNFNQTKLA